MSTFAIIMALGIVVDDAIVVGENIFSHRKMGKGMVRAAVDGTVEVLPSVGASGGGGGGGGGVATTVLAFLPLMFVSGMMGKFIFVLPVVMISMLAASLFECIFILPCHLAHKESAVFRLLGIAFFAVSWLLSIVKWMNRRASAGLDWFINTLYAPALQTVLCWRSVFVAAAVATLIIGLASVRSGLVPFVFFPKIDTSNLNATLTFPNGTPSESTDRWTKEIEDAFWRVANRYEKAGTPVAKRSFRLVGTRLVSRGRNMSGSLGGGQGHNGSVNVELLDGSERAISSAEILREWREETGNVPGAEELSFELDARGPGGSPIEFKLLAAKEDVGQLNEAVERCKARLEEYPGLFDISDSDTPGKWEYRLRVKEDAYSLGVRAADLAETVRAAYFGNEVMRIQRGRHEVKIMVCYPREDRRSLGNFEEIRVQTADGTQRPITELADVDVVRGYTAINRQNRSEPLRLPRTSTNRPPTPRWSSER